MGSEIEPGQRTQAMIVYAAHLRLASGAPDHLSLQGHATRELLSLRVMGERDYDSGTDRV